MPACRERSCLCFAVADYGADDQVGVVERGTECVHEGIAELAALMDRPRSLRRYVAGDPAREGELAEQPAHPLGVLRDVRIGLGVAALEVAVGDQAGAAMAWAGYRSRRVRRA